MISSFTVQVCRRLLRFGAATITMFICNVCLARPLVAVRPGDIARCTATILLSSKWLFVVVPLLVIAVAALGIRLCVEMSRRYRAERTLRFQAEMQAMVMEATPVPLLVQDRQGRYLAVNPAFEDALGRKEADLIGHPVDPSGLIDIEDWQKVRESMQHVFATGTRVKGSVHVRLEDGTRRDALYWVRPCASTNGRRDAVLAAFLDVSDLRRMEQREIALKQQLVELTQALPLAIFQIRHRPGVGLYLSFVSLPAFAMLGIEPGPFPTVLSALEAQLSPKLLKSALRRLLRDARHARSTDMEWELPGRPGCPEAVRIVSVPGSAEQDMQVWNGYALDISEARRHSLALSQAKQQAEAASAAKDSLMATVSHELRTPLSGIVGLLELLHAQDLGDEQRKLVGTARAAAGILTSILGDVLAYSSAVQGDVVLNTSPVSIRLIATEIGELVAPTAHKKGLRFDTEVSDTLAPAHIADARRVGQILLNLLGNAVKFTDTGGVSLRVLAEPALHAGQNVIFEVSDTGIGIDPSEFAAVFEPFVRGQRAGRESTGVGLGLAITRAMVDAMHGEISVAARDGRGTTITITLPLITAPPVPAASIPGTEAAVGGQGGLHNSPVAKHVLIVEDDPLNRDLLSRQIGHLGMTCDSADNAMQALRLLARVRYDAVVTDCTMPGMSGVELIVKLRQMPDYQDTPVFALTANCTKSLRDECVAAGADSVLIKPVGIAELSEALIAGEKSLDTALSRGRDALTFARNPGLQVRLIEGLIDIRDELEALNPPSDAGKLAALAHRTAGLAAWFSLHELAETARASEDACVANQHPEAARQSLLLAIEAAIPQVVRARAIAHRETPGHGDISKGEINGRSE